MGLLEAEIEVFLQMYILCHKNDMLKWPHKLFCNLIQEI